MSRHIPTADTIPFHSVTLRVEDLLSHTTIVGQPGSGKSRGAVRILIRELLKLRASDPERKVGMFCVDGKGDELRTFLEEALEMAGRIGDLVIVGPKEATYNPFADEADWTDGRIATVICETINTVGAGMIRRSTDPFWDNAAHDVLTAMIALARSSQHGDSSNSFNIGKLAKYRPFLTKPDEEIRRTVAGLTIGLPPEAATSLIEFAALPSNTRQGVASSCGTVLAPFTRSPLTEVLVPCIGRRGADLTTILSEGKVILFDGAGAANSTELLPAAILAKAAFARMILSRRGKDVNQTRPVFAVLEEFQRVLTSQPDSPACEINWLDSSRWCGCGAILCTQSISALLSRASPAVIDSLMALCANQMWLTSSDPVSAAYARRAFPSRATHTREQTAVAPPLLIPRETDSQTPAHTEPRSLEDLPPGTIRLRLRDGSIHMAKADLSNP